MIEIITLQVGALATNCYLVGDSTTGNCAVIDAGGDPARITAALESRGWQPNYVLATHGHADHIGAVASISQAYGATFAAGTADVEMIANPPEWLVGVLLEFRQPPEPSLLLNGGEQIIIDGVTIDVLATPGHTPGSLSFNMKGSVFTGDTLFRGSIGRYDLPGGDGEQELDSIRRVLFALDDSVEIRPGHGPISSIGHEKLTNPFLR